MAHWQFGGYKRLAALPDEAPLPVASNRSMDTRCETSVSTWLTFR